jgi:hypothetical protein
MASLAQLQANRRNSQKSTGPRTPAGKTTSSSNSFKTGLYAESALIRGEDPAALDDLAREYLATCRPVGPREHAVVDALIQADWLLRRMRRIETLMWNVRIDDCREKHADSDSDPALDPLVIWYRNDADFERVQRRLSALDRSYHRALADLHRLQTHRQPADPDPDLAPPEIGFVPSPPLQPAAAAPQRSPIGFVPATEPASARSRIRIEKFEHPTICDSRSSS